MTDIDHLLEEARHAVRERDWVVARERFLAAREQVVLAPDDLYDLANCAWWLGDVDQALPTLREAYQRYVQAGQPSRAAIVAIEIAYTFMIQGDAAQSSGWFGRASRLLDDDPDCVERGFMEYVRFDLAIEDGDLDAALGHAQRAHEIGRRFTEPNLIALGVLGRGRILVRRGQVREGMALLDEAMVAAVADELEPSWAGNVYCHLMAACAEIGDLRRAGEWTQATARWCEAMPGAGPFMGICRVQRAGVLRVSGRWDEAEREAARVCDELPYSPVITVAEAHYELGDLRRQRGQLPSAEEAYRKALALGRNPQPGMALLRLAQGRMDAALSGIQGALDAQPHDPLLRARLLPAAVEIRLAAHEIEGARAACTELGDVAAIYGTTGLRASAVQTKGMVLLEEGQRDRALDCLRQALREWQDLNAPFEAARTRRLIARCHQELGDRDAAALEWEAAQATFAALGVIGKEPPIRSRPDGLTAREEEVLRMMATGLTNQQIASELVLSVRTVERHLATVYQKLGLRGRNARAAAVRYAIEEHAPIS